MNFICINDRFNDAWYLNLQSLNAIKLGRNDGKVYEIIILMDGWEDTLRLYLTDEQYKELLEKLNLEHKKT